MGLSKCIFFPLAWNRPKKQNVCPFQTVIFFTVLQSLEMGYSMNASAIAWLWVAYTV